MINELVAKSRQMQAETGNHIDTCINKVAHALSDQELLDLANETGNSRFIKQATILIETTDYSDSAYRDHKAHHAAVAIIADGVIRVANRTYNV